MVSRSEYVDPHGEELIGNSGRDPKSAGGIFHVGHHQVEIYPGTKILESPPDDLPPGPAYHISGEQDFHVTTGGRFFADGAGLWEEIPAGVVRPAGLRQEVIACFRTSSIWSAKKRLIFLVT